MDALVNTASRYVQVPDRAWRKSYFQVEKGECKKTIMNTGDILFYLDMNVFFCKGMVRERGPLKKSICQ